MADASDTMHYLVDKFNTAPAGTREEAEMAKELSEAIHLHGLQTINQDFSYPFLGKIPLAGALLLMALAGLLAGIHATVLTVICLVLGLAAAALYVLEMRGIHLLKSVGEPGCSQNLIARHPAASVAPGQKSRPIVVVAHYDTPRADIMAIPLLRGLQPYMELATFVAMVAELVTIVVALLPLPVVVKSVAFASAIVAALVLVCQGARILVNRFVMPFTRGANDNMSGVAALLGLLYRVRPAIDGSMISVEDDASEAAYGAEEGLPRALMSRASVVFLRRRSACVSTVAPSASLPSPYAAVPTCCGALAWSPRAAPSSTSAPLRPTWARRFSARRSMRIPGLRRRR